MIHSRNIIIVLLAVFALMSVGCHHDSATMQQLVGIDSMVYHQQEREALRLQRRGKVLLLVIARHGTV